MSDRLKLAFEQATKLSEKEQDAIAALLIAELERAKRSGLPFGEEALLSEQVLAKDWLRPEEDRAWANL